MGVTLTGYLDTGCVADVRLVDDLLAEHIRLTRAEPGCVSFKVAQDPANSARYIVHEAFCDKAAFEFHQRRVRASDWGKATAHLERTYTIES